MMTLVYVDDIICLPYSRYKLSVRPKTFNDIIYEDLVTKMLEENRGLILL